MKSGGSEMCLCLFISSFRKVSVILYTTEISVSQHCTPPFVWFMVFLSQNCLLSVATKGVFFSLIPIRKVPLVLWNCGRNVTNLVYNVCLCSILSSLKLYLNMGNKAPALLKTKVKENSIVFKQTQNWSWTCHSLVCSTASCKWPCSNGLDC